MVGAQSVFAEWLWVNPQFTGQDRFKSNQEIDTESPGSKWQRLEHTHQGPSFLLEPPLWRFLQTTALPLTGRRVTLEWTSPKVAVSFWRVIPMDGGQIDHSCGQDTSWTDLVPLEVSPRIELIGLRNLSVGCSLSVDSYPKLRWNILWKFMNLPNLLCLCQTSGSEKAGFRANLGRNHFQFVSHEPWFFSSTRG